MKKIICMLLIIAMMATTMSVIFAGTVTAFAAESAVTATAEADEESSSVFAAIVSWFINGILKGINGGGIFSTLLDDIFDYIKNVFNIDAVYDYLENSGIFEWAAHLLFPR